MTSAGQKQNGGPDAALQSILIVDDDAEICALLQRYFREHSFNAQVAGDATGLEAALKGASFDLIILDLMLPGDDGFSICRTLRSRSDIPIIMVTANTDETDRIIGLELGADDYVSKPFNTRELLARVKAVLRRPREAAATGTKPLRYRYFGRWRLNCLTRTLEQDGCETELAGPEYRLLEILLDRPNQVISRDELSQISRHREHLPYDRTIDIQISRLRQFLRDAGKEPELIRTVRGEGYILIAEVRDET